MSAEQIGSQLKSCLEKVEKNPDSAPAHFNLGLAYRRRGLMESATGSFRKAVEIDPTLTKAWVNLGGAYLLSWKFEEAAEASQKAIELDDSLIEGHFGLGQAKLYLDQPEAVVSCNRRVLELDPKHAAATYFLAVGLLATGEVRAAREELSRASSLGYRPPAEFLRGLEKAEKNAVAPLEVTLGKDEVADPREGQKDTKDKEQ